MAVAALMLPESSTGFCPDSPRARSIYGPHCAISRHDFWPCSSPSINSVRSVSSSSCGSVLHLKRQIVFKARLWGKRLLPETTMDPQENNSSFYCVLFWFTLESPRISGKGITKFKKLLKPWETKCQLIYPFTIKIKRNRGGYWIYRLTIPNL